ncbi:hypothetical protein D3C84_783160 [compost metagenome]
MQLHEAFELKEMYSVDTANRAIQVGGWKLLAVIPGASGAIYVVGKKRLNQDPEQVEGSVQTHMHP